MRLLLLIGLTLLSSCAGYHFGSEKPPALAQIHTISIPLAKSRIVFPRIEPLTTNLMVDALVHDSTYRLASPGSGDATLLLTIETITYQQARSSTTDVLRSEELRLEVTIAYQLIKGNQPSLTLASGRAKGHTRLFAGNNLQTARTNALPDALQRATQSIISHLADGY